MISSSLRKGLYAFAAFAVALLVSITLSACSSVSDEDQIRTMVDEEFSLIKEHDQATIDELMGDASSTADSLAQYGIDGSEFINSWLDGFDYSIGDVTIADDKTTATVNVSITSKQLYPILATWMTDYMEWVKSGAATSQDEISAKAGETMMSTLSSASPVATEVTLDVEKDGSWQIADSLNNDEAFEKSLLGDEEEFNNAMDAVLSF